MALVIVCLLMLICFGLGLLTRELILGIISGFLVLATAGIWISYIPEIEARKTLAEVSKAIRDSVGVLQDCDRLGLVRIFPNSDINEYQSFLRDELVRSSSNTEEVRILAICARDMLHPDGGFAYQTVKDSLKRKRSLRVILAHPCMEFAVTRGLTEDPLQRDFSEYSRTVLVNDVLLSCEGALALGNSVTARLCPVTVYCNTIFINNLAIFEPYHYGIGHERASLDTPAFVFKDQSDFCKKLAGQFELLWNRSQSWEVTQEFVGRLRRSVEVIAEDKALQKSLAKSLPDLLGTIEVGEGRSGTDRRAEPEGAAYGSHSRRA